jgi:glycosyltransferase involved in cell wall biosynthesis
MGRLHRRNGSAPSDAVRRILFLVENVALARDHRLRKQAEALVAEGFAVSVICRRDPGNHGMAGVRLYEYAAPADAASKLGFVREYGYSWLMAAGLTLRALLAEGFDAVQACGNPDIYFTIGAPLKLLGKPLVFDQRDVAPELYAARYGREGGAVYRTLCWLERVSYRSADHVITVNDSLRDIAYRRGELPPDMVTVVGNGPALARTGRRQPRPELRHGRRHLVCWLGLMGPQDRLDHALRAIHELVHGAGRNDTHFAFVGEGEAREPSELLAAELGLRDWVSFPGWVDEEEAFTYLCTADVGLEPNLEEIVSPVKGMEYMAFAVPFVAFDLKETRALAGPAACYAPPGDDMEFARLIGELLDDEERRAAMGRAGRRRVEQAIAWDHQKPAYVDVFRRLLDREVV